MSVLTSLPYDDRRVILVCANSGSEKVPNAMDSRAVDDASRLVAGMKAGALVGTMLAPGFGTAVGAMLGGLVGRATSSGGPPSGAEAEHPALICLKIDDASRELHFPPGHPISGHLYAGHPLVPSRYVPFASLHRVLFEEKVNELIELLASLCATKVRVTHSRGYRRSGGLNVEAEVSGVGGKVAVAGTNYSSKEVLFEEHFRPRGDPKMPTDLLWLGYEPSWQRVAERRLKYNTERFQVDLLYEDDFGISGDVAARYASASATIGGRFENFEATHWSFEGEFA